MTRTVSRPRCPHSGFTLVELLVVIVIIGILAGLIIAGVLMARVSARQAAIRMDISQLEQALEKYKIDYSEYPPDFAGLDGDATAQANAKERVISHIRKRFPRYDLGTDAWTTFHDDVLAATTTSGSVPLDVDSLTPGSALPFWLGGLPELANPTILTGFSADPAHPFQSKAVSPSRIDPLTTFRSDQLTQTSGGPLEFRPAKLKTPYLYLKAYPSTIGYYYGAAVKPYADSKTSGAWINSKTYQIISAGMDDGFGAINAGTAPLFPSGTNFDESDATTNQYGSHLDNITNFTSTTIEVEMKK